MSDIKVASSCYDTTFNTFLGTMNILLDEKIFVNKNTNLEGTKNQTKNLSEDFIFFTGSKGYQFLQAKIVYDFPDNASADKISIFKFMHQLMDR